MQECFYTQTHRQKFDFSRRFQVLGCLGHVVMFVHSETWPPPLKFNFGGGFHVLGCLGHAGMSLQSETWQPLPKIEFRRRVSCFECLGHVVMFVHSETRKPPPRIGFRRQVLCFGCLGHAGMFLHSETPLTIRFQRRISCFGCLGHVVMFLHSETRKLLPKIEFQRRVSSLRVPRTCRNVFTLTNIKPTAENLNFGGGLCVLGAWDMQECLYTQKHETHRRKMNFGGGFRVWLPGTCSHVFTLRHTAENWISAAGFEFEGA